MIQLRPGPSKSREGSPGAVFIWHGRSPEGIEHTNPGKNIRQILAEQSCEFTTACLIFCKVRETGKFEGFGGNRREILKTAKIALTYNLFSRALRKEA